MLRSSLPFLILLLASLSTASALDLSLSDIATRVRYHHPALKAARLAVEEAKGRQLGAGRLSNPSLSLDYRTESRIEPGSSLFAFEQAFPVTRRLSLEKKLTSQLVEAAALEVRDAERKLIAEAQQQVVQLLTIGKQRALRQQQTELAQKLSDFASGRAKAGEVSPLDAKQVQLDAQRLRVESRLLEAQSVSLLGQLKPMLGLRSEASASVNSPMPAKSAQTYRPLVILLIYLLLVTAVAASTLDLREVMRLFMGGFFIAFSFFKMLDLRGFRDAYRSYDLVAKAVPAYGFIYPFIELALGLAYIAAWQPMLVNAVTALVMAVSLAGVLRAVLSKQTIRCACLGTVFNLPMSTVTIVEDGLMLGMAVIALVLPH